MAFLKSITMAVSQRTDDRLFVPVNDNAAPAVGGQSRKYWTQGHDFAGELCTNETLTCLVKDLVCRGPQRN